MLNVNQLVLHHTYQKLKILLKQKSFRVKFRVVLLMQTWSINLSFKNRIQNIRFNINEFK